MAAMDPAKYDIIPIGITKEGVWITQGNPMKSLVEGLEAGGSVAVVPLSDPTHKSLRPAVGSQGETGSAIEIDVVFPVLHGPFGEDGTVQGLLELADIPYVGSGVIGSAVGMDKDIQKAVFAANGLPVVRHTVVYRWQWDNDPTAAIDRIEGQIGYPCFVKPANLGSSVGISKAKSRPDLEAALHLAARFDRKMLAEQAVDAREIEVSVLGNDQPQASIPGEIVPSREFYDYQAKYVDSDSDLLIPAPLSESATDRIRELSIKAFQVLECAGMARVDFLLDRGTGDLYLNEVNTIPGFTPISMYPKLWEASGIPYSELIDRLIQLAIERHEDKTRNKTSYSAQDGALTIEWDDET
jgi:D-alanine-D-alanine ligase